jgi:protein-tyrosine-phosphatase
VSLNISPCLFGNHNKKLIVFVCKGNIFRSVVAEKSMTKILAERSMTDEFTVESYGIQGSMGTPGPEHPNLLGYPKDWAAAKDALDQFQLNLRDHTSRPITHEVVENAATIIAMDDDVLSQAANALSKQFPTVRQKMHAFSELTTHRQGIVDPQGVLDKAGYAALVELIYTTVQNSLATILAWARASQ